MKISSFSSIIVFSALCFGQQAAAPRTADGKPDLSGNWAPNAIRQNVDLIGTGVEVPMQPWAAALYKVHKESLSKDDPEARCLPPGVPRISTTSARSQRRGYRAWGFDRPLGEDTFVADTVGMNGTTWIDQSGIPHTDAPHVIEWIRRPDFGHLEIEHLNEDPKTFTKPWKFTTHPALPKGGVD